MIYAVTEENRAQFRRELFDMHRHRKQVFVDELGWDLPCEEGLEIDAFDTVAAIYLLYFDERRDLRASARMLPTDRPHLLGSVFSDLCPDGVPNGPSIWESTRFCPAPGVTDAAEKHQLLGVMIAGMMEAALLFGVEAVTFVAGGALRPLALSAGWDAKTIGPTVRRRRERLTACIASIDPAGLRRVREKHGLSGPLLRYAPTRIAA